MKVWILVAVFIVYVIKNESSKRKMNQENRLRQSECDKYFALFLLMNRWVKAKQEGKRIDSALLDRGYQAVAIYGMSYVGKRLMAELSCTKITVKYGIDKDTNVSRQENIEIYPIKNDLPAVDAMIVTPIYCFREIEEELRNKVDCDILSLEDILYEL